MLPILFLYSSIQRYILNDVMFIKRLFYVQFTVCFCYKKYFNYGRLTRILVGSHIGLGKCHSALIGATV